MGNQISGGKISQQELDLLLAKIKRGKEVVGTTKNAKLVATKMIHAFNSRDMMTVRKMCSTDSTFCYYGKEGGMSLDVFLLVCETMYASFPDVVISYDTLIEEEPGVVRIRGVRSRGTHTGAPFAYAPFPPIPATGILVEDMADFFLYMSNEKCNKVVFKMIQDGDIVGPAGYYKKIGGAIDFSR